MAALSTFYDELFPDVPQAGQLVIDRSIKDAVVRFHEISKLSRYEVPAISVIVGGHSYPIGVESGMVLGGIVGYPVFNEREIFPGTEADFDLIFPFWRTTGRGTPLNFYIQPHIPDKIRLVWTPDQAGMLTMTVWQRPERTLVSSVPDWIARHHRESLLSLCKWYLYSMPKMPWTNPELAVYHKNHGWSLCPKAELSTFYQPLVD